MAAQELLTEIFKTKLVHDEHGNPYPLDSNIDEEEGRFLQELIVKHKAQRTIEVGCAYGISSLFICDALEKLNMGGHHTIIDPCQTDYFHNIGINNLKKANVDFFDFHENVSEIILPQLLAQKKKFDLGFIDGDHRFEYVVMDFFYLNRLIDVGGIIVLDDCGITPVNKAIRYISNYPAYRQIGALKVKRSAKRTIFDATIKAPFKLLSKILPERLQYELLSASVIKSNKKLNLDSSMVAFQKVAVDDRNWDWYENF